MAPFCGKALKARPKHKYFPTIVLVRVVEAMIQVVSRNHRGVSGRNAGPWTTSPFNLLTMTPKTAHTLGQMTENLCLNESSSSDRSFWPLHSLLKLFRTISLLDAHVHAWLGLVTALDSAEHFLPQYCSYNTNNAILMHNVKKKNRPKARWFYHNVVLCLANPPSGASSSRSLKAGYHTRLSIHSDVLFSSLILV